MTHWSDKYLGQPWTPERNCYYWFRHVMVNEFGRVHLPLVMIAPEEEITRIAARQFTTEAIRGYGWNPVEGTPWEGDAVYLAQGKNYNTHIGVVFFRNAEQFILHARKGVGVVASDRHGLAVNFLQTKGYWRYANSL